MAWSTMVNMFPKHKLYTQNNNGKLATKAYSIKINTDKHLQVAHAQSLFLVVDSHTHSN